MTLSNEEAIKAIKANFPPSNYTRLGEALNMAITLLERKADNKTMKAILNYFRDPRLSEQETVSAGDMIAAIVSDHDLTEGKQYKILEVLSQTTIKIKNDTGHIDEYTVEWFRKPIPS